MTWQAVPGQLMTRWAKDVSPENAWREYPRPQMTRPDWYNLNGLWDYQVLARRADNEGFAGSWENLGKDALQHGKILVPYPIESALSGVKRGLQADEVLWYRRSLRNPQEWQGRRVLLHFGAVDWEARVFLNGIPVGEHTGGYLPFWLDVTAALREGENELVVRAWDPTDTYWQQRGKQTLKPQTIWYTAVSGIWQTVWMEAVPQTYIASLKIIPDVDAGNLRIKANLEGSGIGNVTVKVRIRDQGVMVAEGKANPGVNELSIPLPGAKLWSPDTPQLYDLEVEAGEDRVGSYFGMRKFSLEGGRICLNGAPLFQLGPLDQGYWPDGLYTPPTDEAMRHDIEMVKGLGFNMLRKHVKVEPARYYAYCDQIGMIVWQDMPNGGAVANEIHFFLLNKLGISPSDHQYRRSGRGAVASRSDFRRELQELVDHLCNFPCIGIWVPFNEGWGQFDARETAKWLQELDSTRLVDHASGWFDQGGGDLKSLHDYFRKLKIKKPGKHRALVLSEFGGYSLKIEDHLWDPDARFGYMNFPTRDKLTDAYLALIENELIPWVEAGLSAAIYTQTTDVEIEVNGYVTYDRAVEKMDFRKLQEAHKKIIR